MAQTKSKLSEVLNEVAFSEGVLIGESTCKIPAGLKSVAIEGTSGNLIEGANNLDRAFLLVENSTASEKTVTIAAGESPPALRKGIGALAVACAEKTLTMIPLESARFLTATGSLVLTFTSGTTGKVALVVLKKG